MTWQPIETAPKDTAILCWNGHALRIAASAKCRNTETTRFAYLIDDFGELCFMRPQPTHWTPLGDCINMKWSDFDGEYMSVTREKRGERLEIYCPARLREYLAQLDRKGDYILTKNLRQPLTKSVVQKAVNVVRVAIGAKEERLVIHGWRYNAAKEFADAGVPIKEIQAVTGHRTLEMAQKYTARANQKAASKRARERRDH